MKINFTHEAEDIAKVKAIIKKHSSNPIVKDRLNINIKNTVKKITDEQIWHALMLGLFTSQQKSGPNSPVNRLLYAKPFPLSLKSLKHKPNIKKYCINVIGKYKGIRFKDKLSRAIEKNYRVLIARNKIDDLKDKVSTLLSPCRTRADERNSARFLIELLHGIGSKQSRNMLQFLGLTKYEIPLDSRIMKWLNNDFKFPMPLSATLMADEEFYCFVLDLIGDVCEKAGVYPALLDAAVFVSFDR